MKARSSLRLRQLVRRAGAQKRGWVAAYLLGEVADGNGGVEHVLHDLRNSSLLAGEHRVEVVERRACALRDGEKIAVRSREVHLVKLVEHLRGRVGRALENRRRGRYQGMLGAPGRALLAQLSLGKVQLYAG